MALSWLPPQFILIDPSIGSIVEIVLFMVLLNKDMYFVIKAAILGSILATMLFCLGACFFVGGLLKEEQTFNEAISEAGSGLLFTAYVSPEPCCILKYRQLTRHQRCRSRTTNRFRAWPICWQQRLGCRS